MVHIVGAGPGAPDLITVRGKELLEKADVIIFAGSLVNPALLDYKKPACAVYDSAKMTLEEVIEVMVQAESRGETTVRLHTGDPCIYGAIREQMDELDNRGISYEICPGVSSFCGAASAMKMEYTLPEVTQSVIITRMAGRTPVPERESIASFAAHGATMVIFLSTGMLKELSEELIRGGYSPETPAAICYKATWPEEKTVVCTVSTLDECAQREKIRKTALILVGDAVSQSNYSRSLLYDPSFTTEFRKGTGETV
jgi:precorrin-4/cobalt-precorrin-4 C11-methyltransferase